MVFFPVILLGLWYIFTQPPEKIKNSKIWIVLSFGYLGVLFSHLISCEMVGLITILVCIVQIKKVLEKERFLVLLKSLTGLIVGGMWFWLPMLDYMQFDFVATNTNRFMPYRQEERGIFWAQFFTTRYNVNGAMTVTSVGMEGEMPLTLGAAFLLILAAAVYLSVSHWKEIKKKQQWCIGMGLAFLSMWICTMDFPFKWLGENVGFAKFLITSLQFPWRFLAVVTLLYVWIFVMIMSAVEIKDSVKSMFAIVVCSVLFLNSMDLMSEVMSNLAIERIYDGNALTSFDVIGGEYLFRGFDTDDYRNEITDIGEGVEVFGWEKGRNEMELSVANTSGVEHTLELPLILYKGYQAKDAQTGQELYLSNGKSHRIVLHLPEGYIGKAEIKFSEPWYWRVSELISLAGLVNMIMIFMRDRSRIWHRKE